MSAETAKRFDRIVAILIQLQSKRIVKAQDLADRFEVSLRTVYRDIRTLEASGVPIISEAGVGYSIMEGYRLPPVMFTREEASSFVAADKFMQKFLDETLGSYHQSAMLKIKSVLRGSEKDWISALESRITVDPSRELFNKDLPHALEVLFESIAEKKQVFLKYRAINSEIPTERYIEPVGLFNEGGSWYLYGYCLKRNDYRQFRTDRMLVLNRTQNEFSKEHGTLDNFLKTREPEEATEVVIRIDKRVARYIESDKQRYGFVSQQSCGEDQLEMTFMYGHSLEGIARWYLMFCDYATILKPDDLRIRVKEILEKGIGGL